MLAGWMFFMVEKKIMSEMCMPNSSSSGDHVYFTECVGGRTPFLYGFFYLS